MYIYIYIVVNTIKHNVIDHDINELCGGITTFEIYPKDPANLAGGVKRCQTQCSGVISS